jgi:hypothetical protein
MNILGFQTHSLSDFINELQKRYASNGELRFNQYQIEISDDYNSTNEEGQLTAIINPYAEIFDNQACVFSGVEITVESFPLDDDDICITTFQIREGEVLPVIALTKRENVIEFDKLEHEVKCIIERFEGQHRR